MGCLSSKPSRARQGGNHAAAQHFQAIRDRFETIEEVQNELRSAGLEASEVIVAIDLTKSNEWSGKDSFHNQNLHSRAALNPYQSVLQILCKTLAAFDDDRMIPTFGFGDTRSREHSLLNFDPKCNPLHTLEGVLAAYEAVMPHVTLSGPTTFAPAIHKAMSIVQESGGCFHVLLIIADGQVTAGPCKTSTIRAIVEASRYPLSIIMVGVGDGPFDEMHHFDDELPQRKFDNFQFVNFTELGKRAAAQSFSASKWEADFALAALMELPDQYKTISAMGMLGNDRLPVPGHNVHVIPAPGGGGGGHIGTAPPGAPAYPPRI